MGTGEYCKVAKGRLPGVRALVRVVGELELNLWVAVALRPASSFSAWCPVLYGMRL